MAGGLLLVIMAACLLPGAADRGKREGNPSELVNTSWMVDRLGDESGSALQTLTLTFTGSDRISGHDGCNAFSGEVTMTDSSIRVGDKLAGTMAACPEAVEARARTYRAALLQSQLYRIHDAKLELTDAAGKVLITLAPMPTSLAGSNWDAISYNNGRQAVVSLISGTSITIRFGEDGRLTGHAGCNAYFAAYTAAGQAITIHPPGATRRACAQPTGVMEQEALYLRALATATQYRMSGSRLELRDAHGSLVAIFARSGG
jgi:heat shock protein HslJ